jgi:hypothetical protein
MSNTPPTTVNTAATAADSAVKTVENALLPIIEKAIQGAVPTLALPIIAQIVDAVEGAIANELTKLTETGLTFLIIDGQTGSEESGMSKELAALMAAEKGGDPDAIKTAIQNYANAQSSLVHDDGGATPQ